MRNYILNANTNTRIVKAAVSTLPTEGFCHVDFLPVDNGESPEHNGDVEDDVFEKRSFHSFERTGDGYGSGDYCCDINTSAYKEAMHCNVVLTKKMLSNYKNWTKIVVKLLPSNSGRDKTYTAQFERTQKLVQESDLQQGRCLQKKSHTRYVTV